MDAAQLGDLIRICPDHYAESVVIDKPFTIKGDPEAVEAVDCFDSAPARLGNFDPTRHAVLDPPGDGFTIALALRADDIAVAGLAVEGASVGIDADDRFSGYRIHHNLIRLSTLFGIDFGSEGAHRSRVDQNCLRENQYGLMSELDDDSSSEREPWNARDLHNARLDHNATYRNGRGCCGAGLMAGGPGRREQVTLDHNTLREEWVAIALQNATHSAIVKNRIALSRFGSMFIGGANDQLEIRANIVRGAQTATGIFFEPARFVDLLPFPSRNVLVTHNDVRAEGAAIYARPASLVASLISDNTTSENRGNGISIYSGGNVIRGNQSNNNGVAGISAFPGATGNRFEYNSMHGNGRSAGASFPGADARDLHAYVTGVFENVWIGNDCDTDLPHRHDLRRLTRAVRPVPGPRLSAGRPGSCPARRG